jgi:hypothetical protein
MNDIDESDLADLFNKYGSDKDRNGYSHLYDTLFSKMKNDKLNVLEIGIGTMIPNVASSMKGYMTDEYKPGASLRAWNDYFPNSKIYGMDIQEDTQFKENNIVTYICDSTNKKSVDELMFELDIEFDIIIDDGYHYDQAQLSTLSNFFPYLKEGGIYVIEDIYPGSKVNQDSSLVRNIVKGHPYFFVGLLNNQCVIYKKSLNAKGFC